MRIYPVALLLMLLAAVPVLADEAPSSPCEGPEAVMPAEYYTQKTQTVEGVVTAIDLEDCFITVKGAETETRFSYDAMTRFQVKLKQVQPSELKAGSKVAGLYLEKDGSPYISRVVIITGEKDSSDSKKAKKKKSKRSKRRRR